MANILEKAISIFMGNLNLGCSYLITTVITGLRRKRRAADALDEKWRQVKFYLRTLPKIIKKVQSRDPAFLASLDEQQQ